MTTSRHTRPLHLTCITALVAAFACVSLAQLSGCNTVEGAGEDIEAAGEGIEDAADGDEY